MQQIITDNALLEAAHHQAKAALRAGLRDEGERNRIANRMWDTMERFQYPYLTTSRLIKRIGHKKAVVLGLSRPLINLALKMEVEA